MSDSVISLTVEDRVARIVLNRPSARNAMDAALIGQFAEAAKACAADDSLAAIVISQAGGWFSAGGDLNEMMAQRERIRDHVFEMAGLLHDGILALRRAAAPVVAAVSGVAAGAGFSLCMAADLVVAAESARFVTAYVAAGLTPDGGASFFLPRAVGPRVAFDLLATNPTLSAQQAHTLGLVSRVVPDVALADSVEDLVASLLAQPAGAVAGLKGLLRGDESGLAAQLDAERAAIAARAATPAALERIAAFLKPKQR